MTAKRSRPGTNRAATEDVNSAPQDTTTRRHSVVALAVNARQVRVTCPYCQKPHTHGIGGPGGTAWRIAHCGRGEYQLQIGGAQ